MAAPIARLQLPLPRPAVARRRDPERHPLAAPPPSALPNWAAWHSPAQGIVFPVFSTQGALIKSLPGQEPRTGSNLCAYNKENRPETRIGVALAGKLSRPAWPFLYPSCPPYKVFAVFRPFRSLPHPISWFCGLRKSFQYTTTILLVLLEKEKERLFGLVYLSFLRLLHPSSQL